jgi:long-chain acyl-CoA synthetase
MRVVESVVELIGRTPMVRLGALKEPGEADVFAKLEYLNPGMSVKDRTALGMIRDAEERGVLPPGGTILEATAGNTGVGLALVGAARGYRVVIVMIEGYAREKMVLIRGLGGEVVLVPHTAGIPGARAKVEQLLAALPGAEAYADVVAGASPAAVAESGDEEDIFAIFYTSGTTGLPKGAMVSHRNLVANAFNQFVADGSRHDDVNLVATPLYHMGAVFMAVTYMMLGCTQVILPSFDPARWLDAVGRRRASVALLVPTMINAILENPLLADADLSSLRRVFYGGGPMPPTVLRRALEQLRCGFTQGYGLTETLEATFLVAADHVVDGDEKQRKRLASAGREAVDAEVRIVDGHGRDCATGEVGEVLVRSASVIRGYWNVAEETGKAIRDGWFHTGDLGYLDEDRYLFVVDRVKDMVISGGVNIYSKEVESVLYEHPAVLEAAVIGLPDEAWGEAVSAAVVLRPGMSASADELIAHCKASLAGYKKPRHVAFLDELPKNPSGKILKRELRRLLAVPGEVA